MTIFGLVPRARQSKPFQRLDSWLQPFQAVPEALFSGRTGQIASVSAKNGQFEIFQQVRRGAVNVALRLGEPATVFQTNWELESLAAALKKAR